MITDKGYSKDASIIPEGIALTLPVIFFEDRGMTVVSADKSISSLRPVTGGSQKRKLSRSERKLVTIISKIVVNKIEAPHGKKSN